VTVGTNSFANNPSPQAFVEWRKLSRTFQELSAFTGGTFGIASIDRPESVLGMRVTANYFHTLGSSFFLGRDFVPGEDQEGKSHVVIPPIRSGAILALTPSWLGTRCESTVRLIP
jgi:putative ABC transport system permease protein